MLVFENGQRAKFDTDKYVKKPCRCCAEVYGDVSSASNLSDPSECGRQRHAAVDTATVTL